VKPDPTDAPVEVEIGAAPTAAVIWLHGLGADGHDFEPIVPQLELPRGLSVRCVFPHAPYRAVTINRGYVMRAWYDLALTERGLWQNEEHLREARAAVAALIRCEKERGIPSARIVVAGFSQGANVVLHAGLGSPERLAGVLALSAPLLGAERIAQEIHSANRRTPVFLAHGFADTIVPVAIGRQARQYLEEAGMPLTWHEYQMGHGVCPEEIAHLSQWLGTVLPVSAQA
jgi:phospholipase/carboxylesterase